LPVIVLLKMVAYLDRPAERDRDLTDIAFLIEEYLSVDDDRRWSDEIVEQGLPFDRVSAYALGCDMGAFLTTPERDVVIRFIAGVESNAHGSLVRMADHAPTSWRRDEEEVCGRLRALRRGAGLGVG